MSKHLVPLALLLLAPSADAGQRCETIPVKHRVAHGVYLQQLALRCHDERPALDREIARARDWLGLCREAGGSGPDCAAALTDLPRPAARDALVVARGSRTGALEPIAAPLPAAQGLGPAPRWKTPGLLSNRQAKPIRR